MLNSSNSSQVEPTRQSRLDEFLVLMKQFRNLAVVALGAGGAPYIAYLANIVPPWPPGVTAITALVELVALVLVFQFMYGSSKAITNKIMVAASAVLFVFGALYLVLFNSFTFEIPSDHSRDVAGFICRTDTPRAVTEDCPFVTYEHLADAQYSAELIWRPWTIHLMRVGLALIWLCAFMALSSLIGLFLLYQTKRRKRDAKYGAAPREIV